MPGDEGGSQVITGEVEVGHVCSRLCRHLRRGDGIPLSEVTVDPPDTDIAPSDWAPGGTGNFIAERGEIGRGRGQKQVSKWGRNARGHLWTWTAGRGRFLSRLSQKSLPFENGQRRGLSQGRVADLGKGTFIPASELADATRYGNISGTYAFGAQAAEVEVNEETGEVQVLKIAAPMT